MDIPEGAPRANRHVSVWLGISLSLALNGSDSCVCSFTLTCAGPAPMLGAEFTSLTVTVNVCVALRLGEPLSAATILNVATDPPSDSPVCHLIRPVLGKNS